MNAEQRTTTNVRLHPIALESELVIFFRPRPTISIPGVPTLVSYLWHKNTFPCSFYYLLNIKNSLVSVCCPSKQKYLQARSENLTVLFAAPASAAARSLECSKLGLVSIRGYTKAAFLGTRRGRMPCDPLGPFYHINVKKESSFLMYVCMCMYVCNNFF